MIFFSLKRDQDLNLFRWEGSLHLSHSCDLLVEVDILLSVKSWPFFAEDYRFQSIGVCRSPLKRTIVTHIIATLKEGFDCIWVQGKFLICPSVL